VVEGSSSGLLRHFTLAGPPSGEPILATSNGSPSLAFDAVRD
jgi:hypothetical protein